MAEKLPWIKFFPNDWLSDECLSGCSLAAQGLWIRLVCLMHKSARRGFLQQDNRQPLPLQQIALRVGRPDGEVSHYLDELLAAGVISTTDNGVIFSRRMDREEQIRAARSAAGKKGGNPLLKQKVKQEVKHALGSSALASGFLEREEGGAGGRENRANSAPAAPRDFELSAAGMAQAWCFYRRGSGRENEFDVASEMQALIDMGISPVAILSEVERSDSIDKSKGRDKTEKLWQFRKRLEQRQGKLSSGGGLNGSVGSISRVRASQADLDEYEKRTIRAGKPQAQPRADSA